MNNTGRRIQLLSQKFFHGKYFWGFQERAGQSARASKESGQKPEVCLPTFQFSIEIGVGGDFEARVR